MNCEHHSKCFGTDYDLICTGCPPKTSGEKVVNNGKQPMESMVFAFRSRELFTEKSAPKNRGEQVVVWKNKKQTQRHGAAEPQPKPLPLLHAEWRRGPGRGGACWVEPPLSLALSPLVPHGEREYRARENLCSARRSWEIAPQRPQRHAEFQNWKPILS